MKILAVDTSSAQGSVALVDGAALLGEVRLVAPDRHSRVLLPAIELLLKGADLHPSQVEGFAVVVGPGSFTGLRVGISTVQGLGLASGRPCLGASALDIVAASAGEALPMIALRDAFRGEVYWAALGGDRGAGSEPPRLGRLHEVLAEAPPGSAFVGDAALVHRAVIEDRVPGARFPPFEAFLAATLGKWAETRLRAGHGGGPESLRPLYIRGADIRKASA
jgi:tRNA threonylcarbamoyladenosine biosynthesis protein TsaB